MCSWNEVCVIVYDYTLLPVGAVLKHVARHEATNGVWATKSERVS